MKLYSFATQVVLVNGVELTGWAEGDDAIKAMRRADSATDSVGAGGEMVVSVGADKSGEFTFKLQQTSPSNKFLQQLIARQEGPLAGFAPVEVLCQDTYRNDMANGSVGYLKKLPDYTRGAKANTQEWAIVVENLELIFGTGV